MLRTALRTLRTHRLRFALPALAVLIGVAFVTGSLIYGRSVSDALDRVHTTSQPDVSVRVTPDPSVSEDTEPARLDDALLRRLGGLPGAHGARAPTRAAPSSWAPTAGWSANRTGPQASTGCRDRPEPTPLPAERRPWPTVPGRGGRGPADRRTRGTPRRRPGPRRHRGHPRTVRLVGVFTARDSRVATGGTLVALDQETARRSFAPAGAATPTSPSPPPMTPARTNSPTGSRGWCPPAPRSRPARDRPQRDRARRRRQTHHHPAGLRRCRAVRVGLPHRHQLHRARRRPRREHALLRAIGATRQYVIRMVLTEAALVGAVASVLGWGWAPVRPPR
ncbi:ABC transporter permease [Streptomyces sp. M19]